MPTQQILAFGSGFIYQPRAAAFIEYLLALPGKDNPRITFIPTASGDASGNIAGFYTAFTRHQCRPSHLSLFGSPPDLREHVLSQDIVLVDGGHTRNMLTLWRDWGLDEILREAWQEGIVMSGQSAGAICWFEECFTRPNAAGFEVVRGLGILSGSATPHYSGDAERKAAYDEFVRDGRLSSGIVFDDEVAALFTGTELTECLTTKPSERIRRIELNEGSVDVSELPARVLG